MIDEIFCQIKCMLDDVDADGQSTDEVLPVSSSQTSGSNGDQAPAPTSCTLTAAHDAVDADGQVCFCGSGTNYSGIINMICQHNVILLLKH